MRVVTTWLLLLAMLGLGGGLSRYGHEVVAHGADSVSSCGHSHHDHSHGHEPAAPADDQNHESEDCQVCLALTGVVVDLPLDSVSIGTLSSVQTLSPADRATPHDQSDLGTRTSRGPPIA